jgi:hypothetical protein
MRIKALVMMAAVAVAGAATSYGQVYSQNAVGYVNISVPTGLSIAANPLEGTNNELNTVLLMPDTLAGVFMHRYDSVAETFLTYTYAGTVAGWFGPAGAPTTLDPGEGVFLENFGAPGTHTFVGEVLQGALSNPLAGPLQLLASQVPQALPLGEPGQPNTLEFGGLAGDTIFTWNEVAQGYNGAETYAGAGVGWFGPSGAGGPGPTIPVGKGFWLQRLTGTPSSWDRNFSVN